MSRVEADTMPMMSAASRASRKTMSAVPNISLLRDDDAVGRLFVELADELIFTRLQGPEEEGAGRLSRNDLFAVELLTLELFRGRVLVLDHEFHLLPGRHFDPVRRELVVLDHQLEFRIGLGEGAEGGCHYGGKEETSHVPGLHG